MSVLKKIVIQNFKNIAFSELFFSSKINCISGNNGEGKTNLLDAIYYLSMTKSAFSPGDRCNFKYGEDSFALAGTYDLNGGADNRPATNISVEGIESFFSISVNKNGEKKVYKDNKAYSKVLEHIGLLPIVLISPFDGALIEDSAEERRKFVNFVLSQIDRNYLLALQQYNKLLAQRNKMLKAPRFDEDLLCVMDAKMSTKAAIIHSQREQFAKELSPIATRYYKDISMGSEEEIAVEYSSDLFTGSLEELLKKSRERDGFLKFTTVGIHKDDFIFTMNGYPIRHHGSQGQKKTFLLALKFAQYDVMNMGRSRTPIMLLDDVFDKLDMNRTENLIKLVAGSDFGQIFITDSNKTRLSAIVDALTAERSYFDTHKGEFTKL